MPFTQKVKMLVGTVENKRVTEEKLISFGFKKKDGKFTYRKEIADGQMTVEIFLDGEKIYADVFDAETREPYVLFHVESASGAFVGRVRKEYDSIINSFFSECLDSTVYRTAQTNTVLEYIRNKYGIDNEFPWDDENSIVRHRDNKKWFGAFLKVQRCKIGLDGKDYIEVLNVKMSPEDVLCYVDGKSIFPAYHMNKKHWVTIPFGDYVETERMCKIIDDSFELTK